MTLEFQFSSLFGPNVYSLVQIVSGLGDQFWSGQDYKSYSNAQSPYMNTSERAGNMYIRGQ